MSAAVPSPAAPPPASASSVLPASARHRWLVWLLAGVTVVVFWPLWRWLAEASAQREQIKQGLLLLLAATGLVVWQEGKTMQLRPDLGDRPLGLLAASFACVMVASLSGWNVLLLVGFSLGLAGTLQALFGPSGYRVLKPLVGGVAALVVIVLLFPVLDWPLRQLAGVESARLLAALGLAPTLTYTTQGTGPALLLGVGAQTFIVATECNGFGLITSGALLALLAGGIRRRPRWVVALLVVAGALLGFAWNLVRILVIVRLAPVFPGHYNVLHEVVGTLAVWCGLGLVGWLAWRGGPKTVVAEVCRGA